jgi:type VI secretion system protein ImpC
VLTVAEAATLDLKRFISSMSLVVADEEDAISSDALPHEWSVEDRFVAALAALVHNVEPVNGRLLRGAIPEVVQRIDQIVSETLDSVLHHPKFQAVESAWRSVQDLVDHTNFRANITIDILDVSKEEVAEDLEDHSVDLSGSVIFQRVYRDEYDQFGGRPFGAIIGLYEFSANAKDLLWLKTMGKLCAVAHAPLVTAVSPAFFGCDTADQLSHITDLDGLLAQPRFGAWRALRDTPEAAYIALTLPRYLQRKPWHPELNPSGDLPYVENTASGPEGAFLWGNPAILFARNLARSFERTGWCQSIRGHRAGGLVSDLVASNFAVRGDGELKSPVELAISDSRELEFANHGFIPLIYRPGSTEACVFSCQSIKLPRRFKDQKDTENAQLVTNLSYTLSISRIAHYLKCLIRDAIGTTANAQWIEEKIQDWLDDYVTTVPNPDERTLAYYPFKGARVSVTQSDGLVGHYRCVVEVMPHVQFEGIDVELRLESRLG